MTFGTMELIQTTTVGSGGASSIDFTNIPQTYDDLVVKVSSRVNSTGDVWRDCTVRFNGSTTGFSARLLYGTGSVAASNVNSVDNLWTSSNSATASTFGNSEIYVPNYRGSTNKAFIVDSISENNGTAALSALNTLLWTNTAAITQVTITPGGGVSFMQHTTATLYGITRVPAGAKATGGVIYDDSSYWYHVFTSSGTFTPSQNITCDYLVVAGGGGGGGQYGAGGGGGGLRSTVTATGGGGSLESPLSLLSGTNYTVTIGAGGSAGTESGGLAIRGGNGGNSVFSTITSTGGGGGGCGGNETGLSGGSGGGGAGGVSGSAGGSGTTNQGFKGGNSLTGASGGGGGAGAAAANASSASPSAVGTNGGVGVATSISGSLVTYAGGGGGGAVNAGPVNATGGTGGAGGGGNGKGVINADGDAGTANTGGGGGGGAYDGSGAAGGSGIVIVRYAK